MTPNSDKPTKYIPWGTPLITKEYYKENFFKEQTIEEVLSYWDERHERENPSTPMNTNFVHNLRNSSFGPLANKAVNFVFKVSKTRIGEVLSVIIAKVLGAAIGGKVSAGELEELLIRLKQNLDPTGRPPLTIKEKEDAAKFDSMASLGLSRVKNRLGKTYDRMVSFVGRITGQRKEVNELSTDLTNLTQEIIARDKKNGVESPWSEAELKRIDGIADKIKPLLDRVTVSDLKNPEEIRALVKEIKDFSSGKQLKSGKGELTKEEVVSKLEKLNEFVKSTNDKQEAHVTGQNQKKHKTNQPSAVRNY